MVADWSQPNDEIEKLLEELQSQSIPLYAVFPSSSPNRPIVLRDIVTGAQLVDALRQAGPSNPGAMTSTAQGERSAAGATR
jgi:suppressor for copper-sensitivity B